MSIIATFESTRNIVNKTRETYKPDNDGYYRMKIGGLGVYNSAGAYYESANEVLELFGDSSNLQRRIDNGSLYAEAGHPRFEPGMNMKSYMRRLLEIDEAKHIAHIRKVEVIHNGGGKYTIYGLVKPLDTDLGRGLKSKLDNPHANVAFSIRSFTMDRKVNGLLHKTIKQVITFDYVTEPGITMANKWDTVSTESISIDLDDVNLKEILTEIIDESILLGIESATDMVRETMTCIGDCSCDRDIISEW